VRQKPEHPESLTPSAAKAGRLPAGNFRRTFSTSGKAKHRVFFEKRLQHQIVLTFNLI
jgi:hypothetical protein